MSVNTNNQLHNLLNFNDPIHHALLTQRALEDLELPFDHLLESRMSWLNFEHSRFVVDIKSRNLINYELYYQILDDFELIELVRVLTSETFNQSLSLSSV